MTCNCEQCELRSIFFENVETSQIEGICQKKVEHNYKKGELIIREGDEINDFTYLKSGLVKLYRTRNKEDQIITIAKPFDFVSLLSVFSEANYSYSVSALEDSTTCVIAMSDVKQMIQANGNFAMNILQKMSKASDNSIRMMLNIREKNLRGRIAYLLIYFSVNIFNKSVFELPISRKEIAELINMTTENVIRILSEFRKDQVIKIYGKQIEITDMARLEKIRDLG